MEEFKKSKETTLAFFKWLATESDAPDAVKTDAANAVNVLEGGEGSIGLRTNPERTIADLLAVTDMGAPNDSTSLDNFVDNLNYIKECNELRQIEADEKGTTIPELKVSAELTAMAQLQLNWAYKDSESGHAKVYNVGENIAIGQKPTWDTQSDLTAYTVDDTTGDTNTTGGPYSGWYSLEKYLFEHPELEEIMNNNPSEKYQTGHYENIVDETYLSTGFAVRQQDAGDVFGEQYAGQLYNVYGQTFSTESIGISVSEFESYITTFKTMIDTERADLDKALADAEKALTDAQNAEAAKEAEKRQAELDTMAAFDEYDIAMDKQHTTQVAYDDAVAKEKASKEALDKANDNLKKANDEKDAADKAAKEAADKLKAAQDEKKALDDSLIEKTAIYEKAAAEQAEAEIEDMIAQLALELMSNVEFYQEYYNQLRKIADEATTQYEAARKKADDAEAAYKAAVAAREAAEKETPEAPAEYSAYMDAQAALTEKKELAEKADSALKDAQEELDSAKKAQEIANKLCEDHMEPSEDTQPSDDEPSGEPASVTPAEASDARTSEGGDKRVADTGKKTVTAKSSGGTSAPDTGDEGYGQIAVFTIIAAAAAAGMCVSFKKRKSSK